MLNFEALKALYAHHTTLQKLFKKTDVFLVGGCVRDTLLGITKNPTDIDLTCSQDPQKVFQNLIGNKEYSVFKTEKYGTVTFLPKNKTGTQYECTPLRTETTYDDHRHPKEITRSQSVCEDALRRDFTINAIYYFGRPGVKITKKSTKQTHSLGEERLKIIEKQGYYHDSEHQLLIIQDTELIEKIFQNGTYHENGIQELCPDLKGIAHIIIDPHHGLQDCMAGILRCVGNPDKRFYEDALRLIRALRIINVINDKLQQGGSKHHFDCDSETRRSIKKNYYMIQFIAKERIKTEIFKAFERNNPFGLIALLDETNMLKYLFPALHKTKHLDQPVRYHPFDVYSHSMLTLRHLQKFNTHPLVKLGMLYHDVGKAEQYYTNMLPLTKEEIHMIHGTRLNHTRCGEDMTRADFFALGFSGDEIDEIAFYVAHHMDPGQILDAKAENQKKKLRKFFSQYGLEKTHNILDICKGDRLGQYNPLQDPQIESVNNLKKMLEELHSQEGQCTLKTLDINGDDIMEHFHLAPGPEIKQLLDAALSWTLNDVLNRNKKETLFGYLSALIKNKEKSEVKN